MYWRVLADIFNDFDFRLAKFTHVGIIVSLLPLHTFQDVDEYDEVVSQCMTDKVYMIQTCRHYKIEDVDLIRGLIVDGVSDLDKTKAEVSELRNAWLANRKQKVLRWKGCKQSFGQEEPSYEPKASKTRSVVVDDEDMKQAVIEYETKFGLKASHAGS